MHSYAGLDIALVGVPSISARRIGRRPPRPGPNSGDVALIWRVNASSAIAPFDLCQVADVGDAPQNPLDLLDSIDKIQAFFATLHAAGVVPVTAGGDHTITLPILRALATDEPVGCIHFDAHADTLDTLLGTKINHGTPFRRAVEEKVIDPRRIIQIGLRGTRYSDEDIAFGSEVGMRLVTMDDYEEMGRAHVITEARRVVGEGPTYITFDIDGLDPIYAIGTGAPEPGGLSMRDAQVMLRGLRGLHLIGGDVCEVSPPLDPTGHTALNGANLMFEDPVRGGRRRGAAQNMSGRGRQCACVACAR